MSTTHADQLDDLEGEVHPDRARVGDGLRGADPMCSGDKDSIVVLGLAEQVFQPTKIPAPALQVDTGFVLDGGEPLLRSVPVLGPLERGEATVQQHTRRKVGLGGEPPVRRGRASLNVGRLP